MSLLEHIDKQKIPQHIAIIMDGNGRWAKSKGLIRTKGHEQGAEAVKEAVKGCGETGVTHLTLYAFSTENWKRPKLEVNTLMNLLISALKQEIKTLQEHGIRLNVIGKTHELPQRVQKQLAEVTKETANNEKLTLTLALSYGAREEIIKTVKELCIKVKNNIISPSDIDEKIINQHLYTRKMPDVDLLIRTSGEKRLSNFMLWQMAYAELYFTKVLWPDFKKENLFEAIIDYQQRERRFGKTSEQINK